MWNAQEVNKKLAAEGWVFYRRPPVQYKLKYQNGE